MNKLNEIIKIADIHADRIKLAIRKLENLFPITAEKVTKISEDELVWIELLISRFGKLQDYLGTKVIDAFFQQEEENTKNLTMLDKINKLERFNIIENAEVWKQMRESRNHMAHEYPDHPEITAKYLNQLYQLTPALINILDKIKKRI